MSAMDHGQLYSRRPRVVLADDDDAFRYTIHLIIEKECDIVGEAADGAVAVKIADELRPDVVLLDISMPEMSGLEAARLIRQQLPDVRVIIVSSQAEPACIAEAFRIGAHGYVVKESATSQLPSAIRKALAQSRQAHNLKTQAAADSVARGRYTMVPLQEALTYAQRIVDTVREPMLVLDETLHVRTVSRAFCGVFGVSREDAEGQFIYDLGNGQWDIPALRTLLERVTKEGKDFQDFEVAHDFPQLGRRVMLINARKLSAEENDPPLVLMAIEDITEHKRIHEELVRSNEDLQRFAYVTAHDLRSPLNAALNLSQLLASRTREKLDEQEREMLRVSRASLERLKALVDDILSFSEMGNAPQQRSLISLEDPLQLALANLQHHIEHDGASITIGSLPEVRSDRTQMVMVFQNLIGNALKYRRAEAPHIRVEAVEEGSEWRISVADNGQGFEAKHASAIFEPFKRLHGKNIKGSGIGLATCKRIVERSGGRIWAESVPGRGSTFFFTVPVGPEGVG
jgi:PAS domain S-box-containing protein